MGQCWCHMLSKTVDAASRAPVEPTSIGVASVSSTSLTHAATSLRVERPWERLQKHRRPMSEAPLSAGSPEGDGWTNGIRRLMSGGLRAAMSGAAEGARTTRRNKSSAGKTRFAGQASKP